MTVRDASADAAVLMDRLGHTFADARLLQLALTHRSWCAEHPGSASNERLEFLGDAVLGLAVTQRLYSGFGDLPEGDLAKTRASLVNASTLSEVGCAIGLGPHLRMGRGEEATGGRDKPSIVADAVEAVIAAVYLDAGMSAAVGTVDVLLGPRLEAAARAPGEADFKSRLQELAAQLGCDPPVYAVAASGPPHAMVFEAQVRVGAAAGAGTGTTKKDAEQGAAEAAYPMLAAKDRS